MIDNNSTDAVYVMVSRTIEGRAFKELMVWVCTIAAGYATFLFFEPLYENTKTALANSGLGEILTFEGHGSASEQPKYISASLNLRGALKPSLQSSARAKYTPPESHKVTLSANSYGHFHVEASINGEEIEFMTDTGATYVALTYETAMKLGIAPSSLKFSGRSTTANGVAKVASVVLETVQVDNITVHDVQAVIAEPGHMSQNLLGMSFISKLSGFELTGNKLVMTE